MAEETQRGKYLISAFERFLGALKERLHQDTPSDDPEVERRIWKAVEDAFREHFRYTRDDPTLPFPPQISLFVADALSELLAGGDPVSWRKFRHTGKRTGPPKTAAQEAGNKRLAVCYMKACKVGIIEDKAPNKTVREAFGVTETTVQGWCRDERFNVDPMGVPDTLLRDRATFIRILMEHSGEAYQRSTRTRSQKAITKRNSKRKS
jgi:hypothetical protein